MTPSFKSSTALICLSLYFSLATGCASVPEKAGFDQVQDQTTQRVGRKIHWNQGTPEDQAVADSVSAMLRRPINVDDAVQIALLNNRELQATYENLGVAQAQLVQSGLLRNPRFSAQYLPAVSPGPSPLIGLELAENFVDLFFIDLRKSIATDDFEATKSDVTAKVLDMAGQTRVAFLRMQTAAQLLELRRTTLDASIAACEAAQKIHDAGNVTVLFLARQRADTAQARLDVASTESVLMARRERLNRLMGLWGPVAATWTVSGKLPEIPAQELDLKGIEHRAIQRSLNLAIAKSRVESAAKRAGMTKWSTLLSDLEIGVAADREDDGSWHVGPSVSFQVPLFDQGQAKNAAAASEVRRRMQEYAADAVEIRSLTREARDRLVMARDRAIFCRDVLLPTRGEVIKESMLQYNGMQMGVFELLMGKREEIQANRQYVESLRDYWIARARLELILAGKSSLGESGPFSDESQTDSQTDSRSTESSHSTEAE